MLVSHISDIHLGYSQYNLLEREEDIYEVFEESVDKSISEHVDLVILSGDIFHTPRPSGSSIIKLANEFKKLKEKSIPVFFILGEHDINRMQDVPVPYVFHNLRLATALKENQPVVHKNLTIFGFNKERKSNMDVLLQNFRTCEEKVNKIKENDNQSKNIVVIHQGLSDFNRFAGEINSTDLPRGFDYYAMGHLHEHVEKKFDYLGGLVAYPGSIDLSPSEGIKETDKGFIIADFSGDQVSTSWIKLETRRIQFSRIVNYESMEKELKEIIEKANSCTKKPIVLVKIRGTEIDSKTVASNLVTLNKSCLHYIWQPLEDKSDKSHLTYDGRPVDIDAELLRLSRDALGSDYLASLAIKEIMPSAGAGDRDSTLELVWKNYIKSMDKSKINLGGKTGT